VTRYTITLSDESTAQVDADGFGISDGVLVFSVADEAPPAGMRPVFALNPRSWRWLEAADAGVSFSNAAWGGSSAGGGRTEQQPKPPKVLPATPQPDTIRRGW
jgi:hypothetical protein